jgi:hypothetical protein
MTTGYTTNFGLAMPDFRQGPWHDHINGDLEKIDALLFTALSSANIVIWENGKLYDTGATVLDDDDASIWVCVDSHISAATGSFAADRAAHPSYWTRLLTGFAPRGQWTNSTNYFPYDLVYDADLGIMALCATTHVSNSTGNIKDDEEFWSFLIDMSNADLSTAVAVTYSNVSSPTLSATNVQDAIDQLENQTVGLNNVNIAQGENIGNVPQSGGHPIKSLQTQVNDLAQANTGRVTVLESQVTSLRNDVGTISVVPHKNLQAQINDLKAQVAGIPVSVFPAGTKMLFVQPAPPATWNLDATHHDKALRVVNTATGGTGGGAAVFSSVFATTNTGDTAITIAQMPSHDHSTSGIYLTSGGNGIAGGAGWPSQAPPRTGATGGNQGHSHPIDIRVQYMDVCVGVKA